MMKRLMMVVILYLFLFQKIEAQNLVTVDVCVYGGTSAGVIAAYTVKKLGRSVVLVEPGLHLGGLSSGGLGYTDIGNKYAVSGLGLDFYRRIGKHYGKMETWIFEPHVAKQTFQQYLDAAKLVVGYGHRLKSVKKENNAIREITVEIFGADGKTSEQLIRAKQFIDCSYEGDLLAKAGVSYTVGRESNSQYNETYNGFQLRDKHQFPDGIDPYKIPGKPESGLVWGISNAVPDPPGTGDKKVQAYNFRICLTSKPDNLIPITRPEGYDSSRYELLLRSLAKKPVGDLWGFLKFDLMPNNKTDINNNGPFSTDMIGMNYDYAEADYPGREEITKAHELYIKGLLYFIGHDQRMPSHLREAMLKWGYPKDEYQQSGNWSPQMYVREARRMIGAYVMTQANCEGKEVVDDGVGMAAYTMDSHNTQRLVVNGMVKNEGDVQIGGFGPYPISYRAIIPKASECTNLLVPVCLSATHIAYGSIRMEPVFMVLGQSAATAAVVALQSNSSVQNVDIKKVQNILKTNPLADGSTAEIVVDNDDRSSIETKGEWSVQKHIGYGQSIITSATGEGKDVWVKFTPAVGKTGNYDVYIYFLPRYTNGTEETLVTVFDGTVEKNVSIKKSSINVQGQTSGEWVYLGKFKLSAGKKAYVRINRSGDEGVIVADAVLLRPDFK